MPGLTGTFSDVEDLPLPVSAPWLLGGNARMAARCQVTILSMVLLLGCESRDSAILVPGSSAATEAAAAVTPTSAGLPGKILGSPASQPPAIEALPDPASVPDSPLGRVNGDYAPEISLLDLESKKLWRLSAHVGPRASMPTKVVIVCFSASWCGPCRMSLPFLKKLEDEFGAELQIAIVSMDVDASGKAKEVEAVRSAGLRAPVLEATPEVLTAWLGRKRNIPHMFIVNRAGEILVQNRGFGEKVGKVLPAQVRYARSHPEYVIRSGG